MQHYVMKHFARICVSQKGKNEPPKPTEVIATTTMLKKKKQNQQQLVYQQLPIPEQDKPAHKKDGSRIGPASLLSPSPMANETEGGPKSTIQRGLLKSRGPILRSLLCLSTPPRGKGPIFGGLGFDADPPKSPKTRCIRN